MPEREKFTFEIYPSATDYLQHRIQNGRTNKLSGGGSIFGNNNLSIGPILYYLHDYKNRTDVDLGQARMFLIDVITLLHETNPLSDWDQFVRDVHAMGITGESIKEIAPNFWDEYFAGSLEFHKEMGKIK